MKKIENKNILTYGFDKKANYRIINPRYNTSYSQFDLHYKDLNNSKAMIKNISLKLIGQHNILNLTAALSVMNNLDIKINKKHIMTFKGTMRRMNILGVIGQSMLIDDYAHHPTEIQKLIEVSNLYKNKEVYLIIEPHRYTRLNDLYNDYLQTLKGIKKLNILKTYTAGEVLTNKMKDSKNLVNDLNVLFSQQTSYLDTYLDFFNLLDELTSNNKKKVIIAAGAGSISNQFRLYYETKKR